jgi:hypothetical protein
LKSAYEGIRLQIAPKDVLKFKRAVGVRPVMKGPAKLVED